MQEQSSVPGRDLNKSGNSAVKHSPLNEHNEILESELNWIDAPDLSR